MEFRFYLVDVQTMVQKLHFFHFFLDANTKSELYAHTLYTYKPLFLYTFVLDRYAIYPCLIYGFRTLQYPQK